MSVYEKLLQVQTRLKAPKSNFNSFGKYNYRSCEDILEGVKPHLAEATAIILLADEIEVKGERYYIKATAKFICTGTGEAVEVTAYAREEENKKGMDGSQITGTASSYARKYALNGLLCIDDTKDADATNTHDDKPKYSKPNQTPPPSQNKAETVNRATVKAKFMLVGGEKATDASFDEWEKGQLDKGYTHNQMNALLTKKLPKEG